MINITKYYENIRSLFNLELLGKIMLVEGFKKVINDKLISEDRNFPCKYTPLSKNPLTP